jgi:hypothetical protein
MRGTHSSDVRQEIGPAAQPAHLLARISLSSRPIEGTISCRQGINGSKERSTAIELRFERTDQKSLLFWSSPI